MGSLKFSQQYGNNKISVNQNQKVVTVPVGVVEPGDKHFIGVVQEITEEKFICSASKLSDLIECIKGCNAEVGDEVIICLMQDGQYVVVARVGGDLGGGTGGTETIAPTIAEKFEGIEADILDMRTNKVLWSGANYISEGQTATLSEAISEQVHGIVLVFSLYEPSSSTVKDTDWSYHFIPKYHTMNHNEEGLAVSSLSQWLHMAKYFYVGDTVIRGNGNNGKNSTTVGNVTISNGSYVLRYVLGV